MVVRDNFLALILLYKNQDKVDLDLYEATVNLSLSKSGKGQLVTSHRKKKLLHFMNITENKKAFHFSRERHC